MSLFFMGVLSLAGLVQAEIEGVPCVDWSLQTGTAGDDRVWDMVPDSTALLLTGDTTGALANGSSNAGGHDIFVMKIEKDYDIAGSRDVVPTWIAQRGSSGDDFGVAVTDYVGGYVVAGYTTGSLDGFTNEGEDDIFVMAFERFERGHWSWTYQNGSAGIDRATGIGSNGIDSYVSARGSHAHVIKLDRWGRLEWSLLNEAAGINGASAIAVEEHGDIFVGYDTTKDGILVVSYSPNGDELWTFRRGSGPAHVREIALGSGYSWRNASFVITGDIWESMDNWPYVCCEPDILVMKISHDGRWVDTYQFGTDGHDEASDVSILGDGRIFVTGSMDQGQTLVIMKLLENGAEPWTLDWTWEKKSASGGELHPSGVVATTFTVKFAGSTSASVDGFTYAGGRYDIYASELFHLPLFCTASRASKGTQAESIVKAVLVYGAVAAMLVLLDG